MFFVDVGVGGRANRFRIDVLRFEGAKVVAMY